jgi:hypothetical protein
MAPRSLTYAGYLGKPIHIPDLDVRPQGREMYSPGGIIIERQVEQGLALWVQAIIHQDGHVVIRGYHWDRRENTYWHTHHNSDLDGRCSEAQRRTIWRLWAGLEQVGPIDSAVGASLQAVAQAGVEYSMDQVSARYLDGKAVYLA